MSSKKKNKSFFDGQANKPGRRRKRRSPWERINSIRSRLTMLFVFIFGSTLIAFSVLLYQVYVQNHIREFDGALYNYTVDVANSIQVSFFGDLRVKPQAPIDDNKEFPFTLGKAFFQVSDVNGKVLMKSRILGRFNLPVSKIASMNLLDKKVYFATIKSRSLPVTGDRSAKNYRMIAYLVKKPGKPSIILQVAVPMTLFEKESAAMRNFLWFFVPIVLVVATLGGWFLSASALAPIKTITLSAREIKATNLSERVPVPEVEDEIRDLSETLNDLLSRLQQAFESQEKFIADVSHEMKTPLAILRGELDLIKDGNCTPEVSAYLQSASQEIGHLSELVENLLLLARVDAGMSSLSRSRVRFDELLLETIGRREIYSQNETVRVGLNLEEPEISESAKQAGVAGPSLNPFEIDGDAGLLQVLAKNLIQNAIKFSKPDTSVEVLLRSAGDSVEFSVRDRGDGISGEDLDRIFDRFYRVEKTRNQVRGSGLGLHLAKRIVDIHTGRIKVESEEGEGTLFTIVLPKRDPELSAIAEQKRKQRGGFGKDAKAAAKAAKAANESAEDQA